MYSRREPETIFSFIKRNALLILLLLVLLSGGGLWIFNQSLQPRSGVHSESEQERDAALNQAFVVRNPEQLLAVDDPEVLAELDVFFTQLGVAYREGAVDKVSQLISGKDMFQYIVKSGLITFKNPLERMLFEQGFLMGLEQGYAEDMEVSGYDSHELMHIDRIDEDQLIVYVRMWDDELEIYQKMRWWLMQKGDSEWTAYDYEDLDVNLRMSVLFGSLVAGGLEDSEWLESFIAVFDGVGLDLDLMTPEDTAEFEANIEKCLASNPPEPLQAYLHLMRSCVLQSNSDWQGSLDALDRVEAADPGMAAIHFQRGSAYFGLEQWELAIQHYTKYTDVLGWDADIYEVVADTYLGMGNRLMAAELAEKGLADNANSWGCLLTFSVSIPPERYNDIRGHVQATSSAEDAYNYVIDYALDQEAFEVARAVFDQFEQDFPDSELVAYYKAEVFDQL